MIEKTKSNQMKQMNFYRKRIRVHKTFLSKSNELFFPNYLPLIKIANKKYISDQIEKKKKTRVKAKDGEQMHLIHN